MTLSFPFRHSKSMNYTSDYAWAWTYQLTFYPSMLLSVHHFENCKYFQPFNIFPRAIRYCHKQANHHHRRSLNYWLRPVTLLSSKSQLCCRITVGANLAYCQLSHWSRCAISNEIQTESRKMKNDSKIVRNNDTFPTVRVLLSIWRWYSFWFNLLLAFM